jgi:ATP-binding cassette, subfamily G (WHITE), member 2, SNQ2
MYHPFIESLALTIVDIPLTLLTTLLYSITLYFLIQLQQTAGQFFVFFLVVFTVSLSMKAFFRALAAACGGEAVAQTAAGMCLLALILYTGEWCYAR